MVPVRRLVLGPDREPVALAREAALVFAAFVGTFAAYALGVFQVTGGVVFVPGHAALVGIAAPAWFGLRRRGLVVAWLGAYAALLGAHADHAFLGISRRPLADRAAYFLSADGLAAFGLMALVFGTAAFACGRLCGWGIDRLWEDGSPVGE